MRPQEPRVALFVDHSTAYGRDIIMGVARYVRSHKPWTFFAESISGLAPLPRALENWRGDGVIAMVGSPERFKELQALKAPIVNVSGSMEQVLMPTVRGDTTALGKLVCDHFVTRGFHHFGFFGYHGHALSELRRAGFRNALAASGFNVHTHVLSAALTSTFTWENEQADVAKWLISLPKPIGIMAVDDSRARNLVEATKVAGLRIPEDVAIVGVNNDVMTCEINNPPLSSVDLSAEQIGFEAAKLLARILDGEAVPIRAHEIAPVAVIVRRSSDVMAVPDTAVANALRYIHDNIDKPLYVQDIAKAARTSRRLLERKFRKELGTTVNREIGSVRLQRVKHLLQSTDKPIPAVAAAAGFSYVQQLNQVFKRVTGFTPTNFRKRYRMS